MSARFGRLVTAMITPFDAGGAVDVPGVQKVASFLADSGSEGLVVTGTTGEAPTLTDAERETVWRAVVDAVGDRVAVVAGTGTNDTAHSIELTGRAARAGVHGALVVTPYYNRPPQSGLVAHFTAVAASSDLPVMLYDIPSRTGRKIDHATLVELSAVDNIVAVKDSAGDVQGAARLLGECAGGFEVYCGNDGDTLPWLAVGAVGVVSVASHVAGPQMAGMIADFFSGNIDAARKTHVGLMPVYDAMMLASNPIAVKAAMELMGQPAGPPRLPLPPATAGEREAVREVLERSGII